MSSDACFIIKVAVCKGIFQTQIFLKVPDQNFLMLFNEALNIQ